MEPIFRALADANRRALLDALHERDGRSLGELEAVLPGMTRFGVMKHLRVLRDAGLVAVHRDGRRKLHYLNPVPIQLIADRWISRYARPWTTGMANLKASLEAPAPMTAPKHVYEVYIRTTPEALWAALTDPAITQRYYYGSRVTSDWAPGSPVTYLNPDGSTAIEGQVVELDPPHRLVHTFHFPAHDERPSRVTFEITPMGEVCRLCLVHDQFEGETETYRGVAMGWNPVLSGLKTLLETGEPLRIELPTVAKAVETAEATA
ncbi:MAG: ArsR/SmtB family transcription factor [Candidatus Limnocylindria bacterium]